MPETLDWLADELLPLCGTPGTLPAYGLDVYCGERAFEADEPPFGWVPVAVAHGTRACVHVMRRLRELGWPESSFYVERLD